MPYARTQNYTNSGDFLASEVNSDFDELWLASEQTNRSFEQSVRKPITDSDTISMELPEASSRANKLLGFDATGAVSTSLVTDDAQTIAGIAADIETLAHIQDGTVATDAITNVNTIRTDVTAVSGVASDVTAVAGNTANINTVATDLTGADDIGTVAGSIANVNTVAGDIANVNSVAGNATNINTVAADLSGADDIGTVAGSISSVNTVAPDINHVVTVSGDLAGADNIGTVATNISNVNAVGGISSDVTTVAGISTEVTAVSSNSANINTVGTNITNVNNVGSNIANVNTVAGLETEINAVVADEADIGVVGANITSVNTVSSNINSVNAVYNNMADVNNAAANATAAAASAADANTSAGAAATSASAASTSASNASSSESAALTSANNASQSAATASLSASAAATSATNASSSAASAATSESNADNSETAAAISASNASSSASTASNNAIAAASSATSASNSASQAASSASAAATSATNSETAADTWNSYYSTYLGASATAPSYDLLGQPLQNGALYFNTTDDTMYVFNGSIWIAAESTINIVSVPTQLAADLTTNGNDIIFGDNDRAKFGAGSDLQIYHDGNNSRIVDTGTGDLYLQANDQLRVTNADATETMAVFNEDGAVSLRYNGSEKIATTNTGVDVTGTVTADGLTVDGSTTLDSSGASTLTLQRNGGVDTNTAIVFNQATADSYIGADSYNNFVIGRALNLGVNKRANFAQNGDISFYEDTGTTAKFFWDASAERLGIGTTSPDGELDVRGGLITDIIARSDQANGIARFIAQNDARSYSVKIHSNDTFNIKDETADTNRLTIDTSGNVGIGTSSPSATLDVTKTSEGTYASFAGAAGGLRPLELTSSTAGGSEGAKHTFNATSGAGVIEFQTGGTQAVTINASQNVGIGTSSPADNLHLFDSTNAGIKFTNTTSGSTASDGFSAGFDNSQTAYFWNYENGGMKFATNNAERMRIDSAGNVGIGTGSPSAKLHVDNGAGSALFVGFSNSNYYRSGQHVFQSLNNASEYMRINSSGNVGIGTSSPVAELHVYNGSSNADIRAQGGGASDYISLFHGASQNGLWSTASADPMVFATNNNEKMRIDSSGNVGIGTSSPSTTLHVQGSVQGGDQAIIESTNGGAASGPQLNLKRSSASPADNDPIGMLKFTGNNSALAEHEFARIAAVMDDVTDTTEDGSLLFSTSSAGSISERMRIDSSGNLLVGKTTENTSQTDGVEARADGRLYSTTDGTTVAKFNRRTSDGPIVDFRKNNSKIGSIGVTLADNMFLAGNSSHVGIAFGGNAVYGVDSTGAIDDGNVDLGSASGRFQDLFLSGGAYLGGVAAANKLNDYEEGTWTPTLFGSGAAGTPTYVNQSGNYTKIGDTVRAHCRVSVSAITGASGSLRIGGLPFTGQGEAAGSVMLEQANWPTGTTAPGVYNSSSTNLQIFYMQDDAGWTQATVADEAQGYIITIMYRTAA